MRSLAFLVALFAAAALAEEPRYSHLHLSRINELRARVAREVVRIEVEGTPPGLTGTIRYDGAAVHVGRGRFLTSAFLVEPESRIRLTIPGGRDVPARLLRVNARLGLALLEADEADVARAPIRNQGVASRGAVVYLLLNPVSPNAQLQVGWILESRAETFYARSNLVARNGHPLYDESGDVVGIGVLPAHDGKTSLVVPAWAIREFLKQGRGAPGP